MKIFVKKYDIEYKYQTLWMKEGEEVECYTYYKVDDRKDVYVSDVNAFVELSEIQNIRRDVRYSIYCSKKEHKLSNSGYVFNI